MQNQIYPLNKPMLADQVEIEDIIFPKMASFKLDGIRALAHAGSAYSRALKLIPNLYIQQWFKEHAELLEGLDGELIVGVPYGEGVLNRTTSGVMRVAEEPDFTFYVFDVWNRPDLNAEQRDNIVQEQIQKLLQKTNRIKYVNQKVVKNVQELEEFEAFALASGYEGTMVKSLNGLYKHGRSSASKKDQRLNKRKLFTDGEFPIIGWEEMYMNENEPTINELGRTSRSTSKEGLVPAGTMGKLVVDYQGKPWGVGTGYTALEREKLWGMRDQFYPGCPWFCKVKFFGYGTIDLPRFSTYLALRHKDDM